MIKNKKTEMNKKGKIQIIQKKNQNGNFTFFSL